LIAEKKRTEQEQHKSRKILYCIGCGTKEADYVVGKQNYPLCQMHWEVYSALVLARRTVQEEEGLA
jgi:hypothetical protein